ncbi:BZ3500_MvSof-1268-A1-R1_Chr8-1g09910 [Microbotryum saponariae]|uniref:BZ3500_MvSof-1268-A1-R1_Chr8-1g09910 protein n=1 Tax=Microbotryum saponariae TaxID=289078 RepID=A0A2X0KPX8_9BASI|nr:BZ3500_MvSof-1268-A1-R1_Chr8-1g09910 [Microbotryum saponariae]SDA08196.1 BZ3501_MvSof-1269-A2-R1_Chr8-1g09633 [Microbotryum saponariae]
MLGSDGKSLKAVSYWAYKCSQGVLCLYRVSFKSIGSKEQQKLTAPQWNEFNRQPEWHYVGRYLDFAPKISEIALASVRASLGVTTIPQELITMHIRRGDFLTWREKGTDCTPSLDAFVAAVKDHLKAELKMSSPELDVDKIQVLITTDEQDDRAILDQIAANGWVISQTPSSMIEEAFGDAWKWADSAIAQAILSLGARGFVGTSNSQVNQLTQLRIQSYYKRKHAPTRMVDRTGKFMTKLMNK